MIHLNFNLRNPWSDRWECIYDVSGNLPIKHKSWEVQINRCPDIIEFEFSWMVRQSHAGIFLSLGLFGYDIIFQVYDQRHWDHEKDCWAIQQ